MAPTRGTRFLALIPARGGSKGVPRKNLVEVGGSPLIAWTIKPALALAEEGTVDAVLVSTDDEEIAKVSGSLGAEVPFLRPAEISSDTARTVDVVLHAIDFLERDGRIFDAVVVLQPTSPQRSAEDITNAVALFAAAGEASLISAYEAEFRGDYLYYRNGDAAEALSRHHAAGTRRQDSPSVYVRNGAIYVTAVRHLREKRSLISERPLLLQMPRERSINIDRPEDLEQFSEWAKQTGMGSHEPA